MKNVAAHLHQEAVQSSREGLQDLQQVSPLGCFDSQPPDGPVHMSLMRPLAQYDQILAGHAPGCLERNHRTHCMSDVQ